MYNVGWFTTANGKTSQLLLSNVVEEIVSGKLNIKIPFVFLSKEKGESTETDNFINMVQAFNLPLVCLSFDRFRREHSELKRCEVRRLYDTEIKRLIKDYSCDIVILAGYMLIMSNEMCRSYNMINLHPSLPNGPKGTWREVIWQLIEEKANKSGAMMHLVTPELDRGPVITYCSFSLRGAGLDELWQQNANRTIAEIQQGECESNSLFSKIRLEGIKREIPLVVCTLRALSLSEAYIKNDALYDKTGQTINGLDISEHIEKLIK